GVAHEAGLDTDTIATELDRLEDQTEAALATGYSTNLVVHAFVTTARKHDITTELTRPFFRSMRADLHRYEHTEETLDDYIYGSAEVVGLMCLAVFRGMPGTDTREDDVLVTSARRLGAAFQKVNFLRDLATDYAALGRSYFPDVDPAAFEEHQKRQLVADIRADLAAAKPGIKRLDPRARIGVDMAHRLFSELTNELAERPADELLSCRVRVNNTRKLAIAAQTVATHLLNKKSSLPQATASTTPTAIVIGAGVAGLATAGLLARDGYDVTVFEKQDRVGGRAGVIEDAGFRWDMGPSWWLMPGAFEHFYQLMGTTVDDELDLVTLNEPAFRMFTEGHPPLDVSTGTRNVVELFDGIEPGAGKKLQRYLAGMETDYRLAI